MRLVPELFISFKKTLNEVKASVQYLVSICFGSPQPVHTVKATKLNVDPETFSFLIFQKKVWD